MATDDKDRKKQQNAVINFNFDETQGSDGSLFVRHPRGDYRFKIADAIVKTSEGKSDPRPSLVLTYREVLAAAADRERHQ